MPDKSTIDPSMQNDEYHVASFVAHTIAAQLEEVQAEIINTPGAEIHATSPEGKIVFTIEGPTQRSIGIKIDHLKYHTGLLSLSPVYHQYLNENMTEPQESKLTKSER